MPLGIAVAFGVLAAAFISLCFDFGNGSFFAGVSSAGSYLVSIYSFGLIILVGISAIIAILAGRLIGTTISAAVALSLLVTMLVTSYIGSKPISRFRRLVWEAAPNSLPIYQHEMHTSFSDGTTYTFVIASDSKIIDDLCQSAKLSKVPRDFATHHLLLIYFPDTTFPPDTNFYRGDSIELAYTPSDKKAFVVRSPSLARSPSSQP